MISASLLKRSFMDQTNAAAQDASYANPVEIHHFHRLPDILQRYLQSTGFDFSVRADAAKVCWEEVHMRFRPAASWKKVDCAQICFLNRPARFAYMKTYALSVFPLEALETYTSWKGRMTIKLMRRFTLSDLSGEEVDKSAMVTLLSEVMLIPHLALQPYITWQQLDEITLSGKMTVNGLSVSGRFYFTTNGDCIRFESDDRFFNDKGVLKQTPWQARAEGHVTEHGIRLPKQFSAAWVSRAGNYKYFKANLQAIRINEMTYS